MDQEDRGAHQAKQGRCFEHGTNSLTEVYSLIQGAEIQAEMGGGEGNGDSDEAPQQNHAKASGTGMGHADGALNECGHDWSPLRSAAATHLFQAGSAIFAIKQVKNCRHGVPPHPSIRAG
jgi:hypothetical protein